MSKLKEFQEFSDLLELVAAVYLLEENGQKMDQNFCVIPLPNEGWVILPCFRDIGGNAEKFVHSTEIEIYKDFLKSTLGFIEGKHFTVEHKMEGAVFTMLNNQLGGRN